MSAFTPLTKKQKTSMKQKYNVYLTEGPKANNKLSNTYNLFDDSNTKDGLMMEAARNYMRSLKARV